LSNELNLSHEPRLVAVSKLKSHTLIHTAYSKGNHKIFGENYVQELIEKAEQLPKDIEWHFIGHLQSNKCNQLLKIPNLKMVETVDSIKLANSLNKSCKQLRTTEQLAIMVQVNTSGEESKSGIGLEKVVDLVKHVRGSCEKLDLKGLMTIGAVGHSGEKDFEKLKECRDRVCSELGIQEKLELSMGMSSDYELAIRMGSTNVRVGSTIFGERTK